MIDTTLTASERAVLDAIRTHIGDRGYPPTILELCEATGLRSTANVHWILGKLQTKGWIQRDPKVARAIRLLDPEGVAS